MKMIFFISMIFFASKINAQDSIRNTIAKDSLKKVVDDDDDRTYTKTEIEAEFPGGKDAWAKFLGKNLHYPDDAINNEIGGIVYVQFIVDKGGNISDIKASSGPTKGGLREEAIRVIKLSGKWTPAIQNGRQVRAYKRVPIVFTISKG